MAEPTPVPNNQGSQAQSRGWKAFHVIGPVTLVIVTSVICYIKSREQPKPAPVQAQTASDNREAAPTKPEQPKDGMVYVWAMPTSGHQSVVCLAVHDDGVIDAAYLVPFKMKLNVQGAKPEAVEKLIGGQLRTIQIFGVDKAGYAIADMWLDNQWASEALKK